MRKMIIMAVAGFLWRQVQSRVFKRGIARKTMAGRKMRRF